MLNKSFLRHNLYLFLATCLLLSNAVPLMSLPETEPVAAAETQPESTSEACKEPRLSEKLHSPKRDDFGHLANYWLENYAGRTLDQPLAEQLIAKSQTLLLPAMISGQKEALACPEKRINLLKDLQMLSLPGKKSVLTGIDRTTTQAGKFTLFTMLATETTNWEAIKERQRFIKLLIDTPKLLKKIQADLRNIKKYEARSLEALLQAEEQRAIREEYRAKMLQSGFLGRVIIGIADFIETTIYRFDGANTFFTMLGTAFTLILIPFYLGFGVAHIIALTGTAAYFHAAAAEQLLNNTNQLLARGFARITHPLAQIIVFTPALIIGLVLSTHYNILVYAATWLRYIAIGYYGYCVYTCGKEINERHQRFSKSFDTLQGLAQTYRGAKTLANTLAEHDETSGLYPDFLTRTSSTWKALAGKLDKSTFNENKRFSLITTNHGRVENSLKHLCNTRDEIGQIERFYGEIDAYASMAQLYLDRQETTNSMNENINCCFAEFIENSTESVLHTQNFWHPIIPTDRVRASSLLLGGEHIARDIVVTGPNAGGKSVNLKALIINLMLAQTFGIACAESFKFTPFTKIIARFKSVDDTSGDKSKFMLEAIEMAGLLKEMMALKPTEHAFVETDELFTGTEVGPAISLSIELCARIAQMKNVMYVLATHYKQLTDLKLLTGNVFDNYRVSVFKEANTNKLVYPYTLSKGVGNTNVAFDIFLEQLDAQGVKDPVLVEIINKAKARQENIEKNL